MSDTSAKERVVKAMERLHKLRERKLDDPCPQCKEQGSLSAFQSAMSGPYGGRVKCMACDYNGSVSHFLVQSALVVEPLSKDEVLEKNKGRYLIGKHPSSKD